MKIGVFGGTFNPPHNTHVNIARQAIKQLCLDKLLVVPCGTPPHKRSDVDKRTRLKLSELAFGNIAKVEVWDYEITKEGKSYTVETLREVKRIYPDCELYLVIGGDSLASFDKWYCPNEIAQLATLAVATRANEDFDNANIAAQSKFGANVIRLDIEPNGLSSTDIRLRYTMGRQVYDVPLAVGRYILENKLYLNERYAWMKMRVQPFLSAERMEHTFYVVKRGLEFATDEEYDKVFTACLLHDCAKFINYHHYEDYGFIKPDDMPQLVVHSFLGAEVARIDYGVEDEEILNAIRYHTTGRPNMTRLEKIVYVADKTEQTRPYPLEHLLTGTLDEIFLKCLAEANEYRVEAHGDSDFWLTDQTLEYYLKKD